MAGRSKTAPRPKFQEAAFAEAVNNEAIQCTLEQTEALEKLLKTVAMRADSLATAGLLPDTPRASGGDTARRQRALRTALPDPHHTLGNAHLRTMSHAALCPQFATVMCELPAATSADTDEEELRQNILNALLGIFTSFQPGDRLEAYLTGRRNRSSGTECVTSHWTTCVRASSRFCYDNWNMC